MARWQDKLTKKELQHVKEWCSGTLAGLKRNRVEQRGYVERGFPEPCRECRCIARKLGLE